MDPGGAILILAAVALAMIWLARVYGPKAKASRDAQDARDFEHEQVILREQVAEPDRQLTIAEQDAMHRALLRSVRYVGTADPKPKRAPNGRFLPKGRR